MLLSHLHVYTVRCVDQYYRTRYVTYVLYLIQVYVCGLQFEIKIDEISIKFTVTTNLYSFYEIALRFQINMDSVGDCT